MIPLHGVPVASFAGSTMSLDNELEAMLRTTLMPHESVIFKVQGAAAEALILTSTRIIVLKGAAKAPNGRAYGRFFRIDEILRFEYRGWPKTTFIATITQETAKEPILTFALARCSFGIVLPGEVGTTVAKYLRLLETWLHAERRYALLQGQMPGIRPSSVVPEVGELFYFEAAATYFEERSVRQHTGTSSGVSIPVAKGIRFRVGSSRGQSITKHVLAPEDQGILVIGDRRVVFTGSRRTISVPLSEIVSVEAYTDSVQIGVANQMTRLFQTSTDVPWLILKRLLNLP